MSPVVIVSSTDNGYGNNSIVWAPNTLPSSISADTTYNITVSGIGGTGVPTSYSYSVTLFNPGVLGSSVSISGTNAPYTTGAPYTFKQHCRSRFIPTARLDGEHSLVDRRGPNSPLPQIIQNTTGTYALRQSVSFIRDRWRSIWHSLISTTKAFRSRATSCRRRQASFSSTILAEFATTNSTLTAQISTDNGNTWQTVWSRDGVGLSSNLWIRAFVPDEFVIIRREHHCNPFRPERQRRQHSPRYHLEERLLYRQHHRDQRTQLVNTTVSTLSGSATSFTLNSTTVRRPACRGSNSRHAHFPPPPPPPPPPPGSATAL